MLSSGYESGKTRGLPRVLKWADEGADESGGARATLWVHVMHAHCVKLVTLPSFHAFVNVHVLSTDNLSFLLCVVTGYSPQLCRGRKSKVAHLLLPW